MAGKHWYNNGNVETQIGPDEEIPNGFIRGRLPYSDETRNKLRLSNLNKSKEQKEAENKKRSDTLKKTYSLKSKEEIDFAVQKRKDTWNSKSEEEKQEYKNKLSASLKGKNTGKIPWNKGLTKETDARVKVNAEHTSEANKIKSKHIKETNPEYFSNWRSRMNDVMRANNSFNRSIPEDKYYDELVKEYGEDNVVRWYSDDRYPFVCDFYIPSEDLFIELNKHWTHGGHQFDELNLEDISKLEIWKELAKSSKYYKNAIYVWAKLDVEKSKMAKDKNLNYKVIY